MNKVKICHGFIVTGHVAYNLDDISEIEVCKKHIIAVLKSQEFTNDRIYIGSFETDKEAQDCFDSLFNVFKGWGEILEDFLYDNNIDCSVRTRNVLLKNEVVTVEDFFEFLKAKTLPKGCGEKSWSEMHDIKNLIKNKITTEF